MIEARSFNIGLHILTKMIWLGIWIMQGSIGLMGMSKTHLHTKKKEEKKEEDTHFQTISMLELFLHSMIPSKL